MAAVVLRVVALLPLLCGVCVPAAWSLSSKPDRRVYPHRIVYIRNYLADDAGVDQVRRILRRAASHEFTDVLLTSAFDDIALQPPEFFVRLAAVKATCDSLGLEIIPRVTSAGYSLRMLQHDRNLAAALPVHNALFVVRGGIAQHVADSRVGFRNGSFEAFDGDRADGFDFQERHGRVTFIDETVAREGHASLRVESFRRSLDGFGRVMQKVRLEPFRCYRVSFWVRSENLDDSDKFWAVVRTDDNRRLMRFNPGLERSEDWRQVTFGFNSLDYEQVRIYVGMWGGDGGRFWVDDLRIEEAGMVNVLRREGTPITVRNESTGVVYEEGRDYRRIEDARLNYRMDHRGPEIEIAPGSTIGDGDRLRVDFYQGLAVNNSQIAACLSEPETYQLWKQAIELVQEHLEPTWYHIGFDEVRHGGWCVACERRGLTGGEMIADAITRVTDIVTDINPTAQVIVWSDMLDPNHNATGSDYLFKGGFDSSWEGIPRRLIIACWNYETRAASLAHFDALGHRTIGAAYYDVATIGDMVENANGWLNSLDHAVGAIGIIYTTWREQYDLLEPFGDLVSRRRDE